MEKLECSCGSKRFLAQEQITSLLDEEYNVLDSSIDGQLQPCYTKIWCDRCGRVIKDG